MPPKMLLQSEEYEVVHHHICTWIPIESYKHKLIDEGMSLPDIVLALTEVLTRDLGGDGQDVQVYVHTSTQVVIHILD
jgi:rRNA pseudouridine-1189 N-methylase Emg1 (Nep1/Mra1 family)